MRLNLAAQPITQHAPAFVGPRTELAAAQIEQTRLWHIKRSWADDAPNNEEEDEMMRRAYAAFDAQVERVRVLREAGVQ